MKNIALIIGTRPQIIKSAPIIHRAKKYPDIKISIIHTGQHYDYNLSKEFFNELNLPDPDINLNVGSGSHIYQISQIMSKLESYFGKHRPDLVLVPGDTNSTLGAALAAVKMGIPVAHFEAGARSFDMTMPEEVNRRIVDHISSKHFVVSDLCLQNLIKENVASKKVYTTGDTMFESINNHKEDIDKIDIKKYNVTKKTYLFMTIHREENINQPERLEKVIDVIESLDKFVIFPCHPRTYDLLVKTSIINHMSDKIMLQKPLPYFDTLVLVQNACVVVTDSGGLQKEAYWLKTPCITLRDNTEWMETINSGSNQLVGTNTNRLREALKMVFLFGFIDKGIDNSLIIPNASTRILDNISGSVN